MILYHGTSEENAKRILSQKVIKASGTSLTHGANPLMATQGGYIYLTNKAYLGFYYSMIASDGPEKTLYVFKVSVDENLLLADDQEVKVILGAAYTPKNYTIEESLEISSAVKTTKDLHFGVEVLSHATMTYSVIDSSQQIKEIKQKATARIQGDDIDLTQINWINV